jgi:hypothetical protein
LLPGWLHEIIHFAGQTGIQEVGAETARDGYAPKLKTICCRILGRLFLFVVDPSTGLTGPERGIIGTLK